MSLHFSLTTDCYRSRLVDAYMCECVNVFMRFLIYSYSHLLIYPSTHKPSACLLDIYYTWRGAGCQVNFQKKARKKADPVSEDLAAACDTRRDYSLTGPAFSSTVSGLILCFVIPAKAGIHSYWRPGFRIKPALSAAERVRNDNLPNRTWQATNVWPENRSLR